jgi:AcrR family transcriptional regulator
MAQAKGLREQKKEQTRAAIAHTAIGLFLQRGFEQVSIAEIAEAAGVAKQTVTNYFPNKEDLVLSAQPTLTPDLAGAVRGRAPGESPVAALYRLVRRELDRRAEWTGLHDGVTQFARMSLASPTLIEAFARLWGEVETNLALAFEELTAEADGSDGPAEPDGSDGLAEPDGSDGPGRADGPDGAGRAAAGAAGAGGPGSAVGQAMALLQAGWPADEELARLAASITVPQVRADVAAGQVAATLRALTTANLLRQAAGMTTEQTAAQSYAETAAAFALLESGLSAFSG